jgi:hypothetical protein
MGVALKGALTKGYRGLRAFKGERRRLRKSKEDELQVGKDEWKKKNERKPDVLYGRGNKLGSVSWGIARSWYN